MSERRALLSERPFRLYLVGQTTSSLGSSISAIALAFAVFEVTGSLTAVGYVLAASRLPLVLFVLVGGVVGDRLSRRRVLIAADLARFATQATAAGLLLADAAELWHLLGLSALHGLAQAFATPAATGFVADLVAPERLHAANAVLGLSRSTTGIGGQLLGGILVGALGAGGALAIDAMTFLVGALTLVLLPLDEQRSAVTASFLAELREGWLEVRSRTWLWVGVVHISFLNAFALVAFFALGPAVAERSLGGAAAWGAIGAAFAAGMVAGGLLALRLRPEQPLVVAFAVIFAAAPQLVLLAVAAPVPLVATASFLGGAQASVWGVLWTTTMQEHVPRAALSRVAAYSSLGSLVLAPLGYALVGPAADLFGLDRVLWAGAAWIAASTAVVVCVPSIRAIRRGDHAPADARVSAW